MCPTTCQVVIDQFNGSSWSSQTVGLPSGYMDGNAALADSTCPTSLFLKATGTSWRDETIIKFNGGRH